MSSSANTSFSLALAAAAGLLVATSGSASSQGAFGQYQHLCQAPSYWVQDGFGHRCVEVPRVQDVPRFGSPDVTLQPATPSFGDRVMQLSARLGNKFMGLGKDLMPGMPLSSGLGQSVKPPPPTYIDPFKHSVNPNRPEVNPFTGRPDSPSTNVPVTVSPSQQPVPRSVTDGYDRLRDQATTLQPKQEAKQEPAPSMTQQFLDLFKYRGQSTFTSPGGGN